MLAIRTALLSVYDKTGLGSFATGLAARGVRLVSTGGTARALRDSGVQVQPIEELTGQPEMLGGRVKTLHPKIFGGILARRESPEQMAEIEAAGVVPIDLVVANLYPFRETIADPVHRLGDALEQIDIGGVSLLRAAYKNFPAVVVMVDPGDYGDVLRAIDQGTVDLRARLCWAQKAVAHTLGYEAAIGAYITALDPAGVALAATPHLAMHPGYLGLVFEHAQALRYGENPHQPAAFYSGVDLPSAGLGAGQQLQGKELSFNNFLDIDAAWQLAWSLGSPGAAIIKHANPCGAAIGESLEQAYVRARATDPTSAFGGIVGLNVAVDGATAREIATTFIEVVVAPAFSNEARETLAAKASLRLIELGAPDEGFRRLPDCRWVSGGLLVQGRDLDAPESWEIVSQRAPTADEERDLHFVWRVVPAVRSNAIILGRAGQLIGVGAGQMSRVDACRFAAWKAQSAGHAVQGCAAASDAFFPFSDGLERLAEAGVTAIVQPGGSKRDVEVIAAADSLGVALVHTGARHFRH